ncbi:solute carrier family 22 member 4-like [Watersipora subatra]|uniref:solute carrier family 22 member 4-like n=1 Tax=Watersipora subatra TaxID=2589382 RepID=UPI00355C0A70
MWYDDSFTSIVSQFDLVCDKEYISSLVTTIQMIGLLAGAAVFGQLGDIIGRRKVLLITYALLLVSNAASGFASSWQLYAAIRFLVGACIAGLLIVNLLLPVEYVGKQWRTLCGCVGTWAIGVATLPLFAFLIRDWTYLCLAISIAGIPILVSSWFLPESCRWLVTRGRYQEAEAILIQISKRNGRSCPDMKLLRSFAQTEKELLDQEKSFSYWNLCQSRESAIITFTCMFGWFAGSSVYYGLSYNLPNLSGNIYLNCFISGIIEIPALFFVLAVNNRIGRRWTVFILFLVGAVAIFIIIVVDAGSLTFPIQMMAFIGKSAIAGGWAGVIIFSAEKFPTLIRNIGVASCSMASRIGGIVAPQLVLLGKFAEPLPFVVFGVISALCAISFLFMSETAQLPLVDKIPTQASVESPFIDITQQSLPENHVASEHLIEMA